MNVVRSLVLALALTGSGVATLAVTDARAADVFEEAGYLAALPVASVPGDGATVADLVFVALKPDGTPATGIRAKLSATSGTVGDLTELEPGIYTAQFTPPVVDSDTPVTVSVQTIKTKTPTTVDVVVPVTAAPLEQIEVGANPDALVLGKDDGASLTIVGAGELLTGVSAGEVENITPMPGGQMTARYTAPKVNFPQLAMITMADASDPVGRVGHQVIPLHGKVKFPVSAPEGANVILEIAGRKFGPVKADADGKAKVPVEVPPGINEAVQVIVDGDESTKETIDLKIPATRRAQLFPMPATLPADEGREVPLRVLVATPTGEVDSSAKPTFEVSGGTVTGAAHTEGGVYEATWLLPGGAGDATVSVSLGDDDTHDDSVTVELVEARPATVTLTADPPELSKKHTLTAKVAPNVGTWKVEATGGQLTATGDNDGEGTWTAELETKGRGDVVIDSWVETDASANAPWAVVVTPARTTAPSDGVSATTVFVAAVDAWGVPVADQTITLALEGPGALPKKVTTDDDGVATVVLTSGKEPGLASITATVDGLVGAGAVLQLPRGVEGPSALPAAGTEARVAIAQRWLDTTPGLRFERGGDGGAAAAPVVEGASASRPAEVVAFLLTAPEAVRPGAVLQIEAVALDGAGDPIEGFVPEFMTTRGELGEPVADAEGATVGLTVPDDAEGSVKVSAMGGDGVLEMVEITIDPDAPEIAAVAVAPAADDGPEDAASAWGSLGEDDDDDDDDDDEDDEDDEDEEDDDDAVADAGMKTEAPIVERRPSAGADAPWLRARLSGVGSTYRFTQAPSSEPGPLLPSTLAVGGPDGGAPASPFGGEIDVRAWGDEAIPEVGKYLGVHGQFRMTSYGIAADEFADVAQDLLYNAEVDLLGRFPFETGDDVYWVGAKAGFHYNDFILFTGCLEADCTVNFEPLGVPGAALGVELGAEVLDLYLIGGYTFGLAQFSKPYSNAVDVNIGYGVLDNVFADLGLSMLTRRVLLEGQDSGLERGELTDSHLMIKLGAGFQLR